MTYGTTRRDAIAAAIAASLAGAFALGKDAGAAPARGKLRKARRRCKTFGRGNTKRALLAGFEASSVGIVIEIKGDDLDAIRSVCNSTTINSDECQAAAGVIQTSSVGSYVDTLMRRIEANR